MDLTVSIVQMDVLPAQPDRNLEKADRLIANAAQEGAMLVCLPEMWTTGFQWGRYEDLVGQSGTVIQEVAGIARQYKVWINGSVLDRDERGHRANTSILWDPAGNLQGVYRKTHLFTLIDEQQFLAPGDRLVAVDLPWGRTGLAICYDLRFPELFRTYALRGVILQLLPAAWPHPRLDHWRTLVRARAIENQMFMVAVNQAGNESVPDLSQITYCGHSAIIDPWGKIIAEAGEDEQVLTATIDIDEASRVRQKMTVLSDRRPDLYGG